MKSILLIEDNKETQKIVVASLSKYEVICAESLKEAEQLLSQKPFLLILLDIQLPDGDGLEFFLKLQSSEYKSIPVVFLTARGQTMDKVMGFRLGAEDYITKPFEPIELQARIESRIQKLLENESKKSVFKKENLVFELLKQRAFIELSAGPQYLSITPFEFKLLLYLAQHEDHLLTREQIVQSVWQEQGLNVLDRTVDTHMSHLRQKIKHSGFMIQSVYGAGYRFYKNLPNQVSKKKDPVTLGSVKN